MSNAKLLPAQRTTKSFVATLVAKHLIGADYCYSVYNKATSIRVGTIDGSTGDFHPSGADCKITVAQMRELAQLCGLLEAMVKNLSR